MPRLAPGHEVGVALDALLAVVGPGAGGVDEGDAELPGELELGSSGRWGCSSWYSGIVPAVVLWSRLLGCAILAVSRGDDVMQRHQLKIDLPLDLSPEEVRLLLAIKLYEAEKVSLGQAAKVAGFSKRAFMEILGRHQIPVFRYSPEDLRQELAG